MPDDEIKNIALQMVRAYERWLNKDNDFSELIRDPILGDYAGNLENKKEVFTYILSEGKKMLKQAGLENKYGELQKKFIGCSAGLPKSLEGFF